MECEYKLSIIKFYCCKNYICIKQEQYEQQIVNKFISFSVSKKVFEKNIDFYHNNIHYSE